MNRHHAIAMFAASMLTAGCGQPIDSETAATATAPAPGHQSNVTLSVSDPFWAELPPDGGVLIPSDPAGGGLDDSLDDNSAASQQLKTIRQLRAAPISEDQPQAGETQRKRNLRIVQLATEVLRLSMGQPQQAAQFDAGIRQLLEARYQLALHGTDQDVEQLYADVQALNDRDPNSAHAADGIYYLAKFAHTNARLLGRNDSMWFENFSRWAREFADRFPQQSDRAASLLFGAGRSCEMHSVVMATETDARRLRTEAQLCYALLVKSFGGTTQGQEATAVLRRMALPGKRLSQFAGPTLDGGYVNADDLVAKVTVIYFWDSENAEFVEKLLPLLQQAAAVVDARLRFIGVPLDDDESRLRSFVKANRVPGQQIFFAEAAQRSWNSPLVRFWGISRSPSVWLVEPSGIVRVVDVGGPQLVEKMRPLFQ